MKTTTLTILLSIAILMFGASLGSITYAAEKPPTKLTLDIVGLVDKPGRVSLSDDETVEKLFKLVEPNSFAYTRSILVFRVSRIHSDDTKDMIEGDDRQILELQVTPKTKLRSLKLQQGDVIYIQQKRPV